MENSVINSFIFMMLITCHSVWNQSYNDVSKLKSDIFTNYDKTIRPVHYQYYSTIVFMDLALIGINDLDEVSETLTTTGCLHIQWTDEKLTWDKDNYDGITYLNVPQTQVWKPDIQLKNGLQKFKELGGEFMYLNIASNGDVVWKPFETLITKCPIAIKYFPFDTQTCDITFMVWSLNISDVELQVSFVDVNLFSLESNGEWNIVSTTTRSEVIHSNSEITYTLSLKRKPHHILLNLIIPLFLLTILDIFTFVIPVESGEKMSFCMTVFLSFAVFLTIVSESLPGSSNGLSLLGIYLVIMLIQGFSIILITTIELRLYFRGDERPVPKYFQFLIRYAQKLQCRKRANGNHNKENNAVSLKIGNGVQESIKENESKTHEDESNQNMAVTSDIEYDWKDVVGAMDYFLFMISSIIILVSVCLLFAFAIVNV